MSEEDNRVHQHFTEVNFIFVDEVKVLFAHFFSLLCLLYRVFKGPSPEIGPTCGRQRFFVKRLLKIFCQLSEQYGYVKRIKCIKANRFLFITLSILSRVCLRIVWASPVLEKTLPKERPMNRRTTLPRRSCGLICLQLR